MNDKQKLPLNEYIAAWLIATIAGIFMIMASSCARTTDSMNSSGYSCIDIGMDICLCERDSHYRGYAFTEKCHIVDKWRVDKQEARDE